VYGIGAGIPNEAAEQALRTFVSQLRQPEQAFETAKQAAAPTIDDAAVPSQGYTQ